MPKAASSLLRCDSSPDFFDPVRPVHALDALALRLAPYGRLVVLDFETTDSATGGRPVEVAAIALADGAVQSVVTTLIDPGCAIDEHTHAVHGISDADVRGAPSFVDLWPDLRALLDGAVAVAHNASFDAGILRNEIRRLDLDPPSLQWWCSLRLARRTWPRRYPSYSLSALRVALRFPPARGHRALADAENALRLLAQLAAASPDLRKHAALGTTRCWPW